MQQARKEMVDGPVFFCHRDEAVEWNLALNRIDPPGDRLKPANIPGCQIDDRLEKRPDDIRRDSPAQVPIEMIPLPDVPVHRGLKEAQADRRSALAR